MTTPSTRSERPTTRSPGDDARRWREGTVAPRDAEIRASDEHAFSYIAHLTPRVPHDALHGVQTRLKEIGTEALEGLARDADFQVQTCVSIDLVRTAAKSKMRPPTTSSPGDESRRRREGVSHTPGRTGLQLLGLDLGVLGRRQFALRVLAESS